MAAVSKQAYRYQDWANLVLAICLFVSPWVLGFADTAAAAWNAWAFGVVIAALAIAALSQLAEWEEWVVAVLGVWVAIAPWVLGFTAVTSAVWSHVILGILIAVIAAWSGWSIRHGGTQAVV